MDSPLQSVNDAAAAAAEAAEEQDRTLDLASVDPVEENDEAFLCCICLDLLYKPIVLACGHISCFWCTHRAMNGFGKSYCPICRCPYRHFPSICQLLHFLLLKMYPVAYRVREKQMLEEEKKVGFFSPQFKENLTSSNSCEESDVLVSPSTSSISGSQNVPASCTFSAAICIPDITESLDNASTSTLGQNGAENVEADRNMAAEVKHNFTNDDHKDKTCVPICTTDLQCIACSELLFRPVVLNCGHVYCESCIFRQVDEQFRCQLCESPHPKGLLNVCLELDRFLEEHFSKEYAIRREAIRLQHIDSQQSAAQGRNCFENPFSSVKCSLQHSDLGRNIHHGVGCDYCGMFPIIGERHKCKDCEELIGFDLCGECYNSCSKRPGRFNQQHKPEHKFELVRAKGYPRIMLRLASESSEDGSFLVLSDDASEDPEDGQAGHSITDDVLENSESTNSTT
ncbi:hypothetical protein Scep_010542 [Stephania cephalantha]|uniref:E3 ubiquitin-protein ligase PRT1 n=1 Tax=Stephania cephalantha TaxID=152367 RepID=A0AAP0PHC5_9MAGN